MKWNILSRLLVALSIIGICSCQDEELFPAPGNYDLHAVTRAESGKSSGLELQSDGFWKAKRRVPLVGMGRIVNFYADKILEVGDNVDNLTALTDLILTNEFSPKALVSAGILHSEIASIRDLNHIYAGEQKAGFLCKLNNSSLLNAELLRTFTLITYLKGNRVESHTFTNASGVLDLGIGNIAGSNDNTFLVETTFTKPFDEIRLSVNGITAAVAEALTIYYAYVGENEMIPAVNNGGYFGNNVTADGPYFSWTLEKLINDKLTDGITFSLLGGLLTDPHMTIDFGKEIPAGSEVGFYVTAGKALELGAGHSIRVRTFDEKGGELETYSYTQVVELGLLGGGKYIFSLSTKKPCRKVEIQFFGVDVTVGATTVHYAFLREGTKVDPSSNFSVGNITVYTPVYRLPIPKEGSVTYELKSQPGNTATIKQEEFENVKGPGFILTGMDITGDYVVKATYTDSAGNISEHIFVVTREKKKQISCETQLVNTKEHPNRYQAYVPDSQSLLEIGSEGKENSPANIVDEDLTNEIIYKTNLKVDLIRNKALVGIHTMDNSLIYSGGNKIRAGFVISKTKDFLGVNLLKFLRIKLYKGSRVVNSGLAHENDAVSVCVAGGDKNKVRLSIETYAAFDKMELYCTELLAVDIAESLRVYYAYTEEISDKCIYPGEECMQLITNANYGAVPSVRTDNILQLIGAFTDLGNIVDTDINSFSALVGGVNLLSGKSVSVKFNPIKGMQEVGFILSGIPALTDVALITQLEVKAYLGGQEVANNTGITDLLKLKLIGSGDKSYLSITPPKQFDELRLTFKGVTDVLKSVKIHGVFIRPDYDGDGAIDCLMDNLEPNISGFKVYPEDICEGGDAAIRAIGGEPGTQYKIAFSDDNMQKTDTVTATIDYNGYLKFTDADFIKKLPAGIYGISVTNGQPILLNRAATLTVHPTETTWKGNAGSSDWNQWSNWDRGIPWECTNVIIPTNAATYPVLDSNDKATCLNIHFEPGAELIGQAYLNYVGKAFVDVDIQSGAYQLFSAPLKDMQTGDMFVYQGDLTAWNQMRKETDESGFHTNYFKELNEVAGNLTLAYGEQRTNPVIYQRFYSKMVENTALTRAVSTDDPAIINQPNWSRTFNAVSTVYELGQGFAMRAGEADGANTSTYSFHFPKSHTAYHYYDLGGNALKTETFTRKSVGRLMVENLMPSTITLTQLDNSDMFLFGNPFMAHINIQKFLDANKESIEAVYVYVNKSYQTIQANGVSTRADATTKLAPMQAMFVKTKVSGKSTVVRLSFDMLEQRTSVAGSSIRKSGFSPLYLSARVNRQTASCVVLSSNTRMGNHSKNASLLLDEEANPEVAVYTVADGKALSIRYQQTDERIPLGFYMKQTGQVKLSFETRNAAWKGWRLVDSQTGQAYGLDETVTLNNVASGAGRFYLEKED